MQVWQHFSKAEFHLKAFMKFFNISNVTKQQLVPAKWEAVNITCKLSKLGCANKNNNGR